MLNRETYQYDTAAAGKNSELKNMKNRINKIPAPCFVRFPDAMICLPAIMD